jgi:hypothetical protein
VDTVVDSEGNVAIPIMTTARTPANTKLASITELRSIIVFTPFPLHESRTHSNRLDLVLITVASRDPAGWSPARYHKSDHSQSIHIAFISCLRPSAYLASETLASRHIGVYWLSIRI